MVSNLRPNSSLTIPENDVSTVQRDRNPQKKRPKAPWGSLKIPPRVHFDESDIYDYQYRLANAISLIQRSTKISARDKELIWNFDKMLQATNVSIGRRAKYLYHLKTIGENFGTRFEKAKRPDVETFVGSWLNTQNYKAQTRNDYIIILKRLFKFIRTGSVEREIPFPEEVRFLKSTIKANERELPEFLTPADVESMIGISDNQRDRAMLAVGFEAGLRASELLLLNVGDVSFDELGAIIMVRHGKTGSRRVRLISSAPILTQFLDVHPKKHDISAPLWPTESTNYRYERMSWQAWSERLKRIARDAGLPKRRIHNHMLRHGSATEAAKILKDSELKVRYGWSMTSKMASVYVHLSSQDLDAKLSQAYAGKVLKPMKPEFSPTKCIRCGEDNSPATRYCQKCGSPLDPAEIERAKLEPQMIQNKLETLEKVVANMLSDGKNGKK
jgi:integrase